MILIAGLGNPGENYELTAHNAGFIVLDKLQASLNSPDFALNKKLKIKSSKLKINDTEILLAKPETFMNKSGEAVKKTIKYYNIDLSKLYIIHDDIDIEAGEIKITKNRGSAGHKGVQSIIDNLKTKDFTRIRIGIRLEEKIMDKISTEKYVLKKLRRKNYKLIEKGIDKAVEYIQGLVTRNP